jgi:erythromycin esterase-like protein
LKALFTAVFCLSTLSLCAINNQFLENKSRLTAGPSDSLKLDSLIKKQVFKFEKGNFEGQGWDFLQKEIANTQFLMIGEQHGEAEIPVFTTKIAEIFKPTALVTEIDPFSVMRLKKISVHPDQYAAHFKQNPYDFAFYCWEPEMELARQMQLKNIDIWGVNELNTMGLGSFFDMLANEAKSPANKKKALQKKEECFRWDLPIYQDVNRYGDFRGYHITTATVDSLIVDFQKESNLSKQMLNYLKLSIPTFGNRSYQLRTRLMKKNLMNYLASYITSDEIKVPKLIFKLGANHLTRTEGLTGHFEVGNLANNIAASANKNPLHILIYGKKGTINMMGPLNNSLAIQPNNDDKGDDLGMLSPFTAKLKDKEWATFDLRPIRKAVMRGKLKISEPMKEWINGYDLLVIFSESTGSRFIE